MPEEPVPVFRTQADRFLFEKVVELGSELKGFQEFMVRVEGYEQKAKNGLRRAAIAILATLLATFSTAIGITWYLGWKASAVVARVDDLTTSIGELKTATKDASKQIGELRNDITNHGVRIGQLEESTKLASKSVIKDTGLAVDRMIEALKNLGADMKASANEQKEQSQQVTNHLKQLDDRFKVAVGTDSLPKQFDDLKKRIDRMARVSDPILLTIDKDSLVKKDKLPAETTEITFEIPLGGPEYTDLRDGTAGTAKLEPSPSNTPDERVNLRKLLKGMHHNIAIIIKNPNQRTICRLTLTGQNADLNALRSDLVDRGWDIKAKIQLINPD